MNAQECIDFARKHMNNDSDMQESAQLCIRDAERVLVLPGYGELSAMRRAMDSLAYSVSVFHPDYKAVRRAYIEALKND